MKFGATGAYRCMSPKLKDRLDAGVGLQQEELPPLLPADLAISITINTAWWAISKTMMTDKFCINVLRIKCFG